MTKKNYIYSILAALLLAVVAFMFFFPDDMEGNVLQQHDIMQGIANGQEGVAFHEATGETTRWTNSLFGGMPNFQIAPSYPANSMLGWVFSIYTLWLPSPANLLFAMMLGFFILCLCMKMKWPTALFAAIAWGFSTYFIIIIGAGHIWKFLTLCYIPPTIGGLFLLYRGKYLSGTALTALFGAMQLQSNHPQMTYYFLFVIFFLLLAWLWIAIKSKTVAQWVSATCLAVLAALFAVGANSASLYNSLQYSKETVRGKSTELTAGTPRAESGEDASGMDRNAITAWSYGQDETFTLLIPNVKGGATIKPVAGQNAPLSLLDTPKGQELNLMPEEMQVMQAYFMQYFGNQPMTNGPVYVGAFVLLLAILAMFTVNGPTQTPIKWALFAASMLAILLSWGHNFPAFTDFFIDHFPGYNKFRAVASILVIVEFCVPLLAAMVLIQMASEEDYFTKNKWTVVSVFGLGAVICFLGWVSPSIFGEPFSQGEIDQLNEAGLFGNPSWAGIIKAVSDTRLSLVSADSLRSLIFILLGAVIVYLYAKGALKNRTAFICALTLVTLIDLYSVNKRYVSTESFTTDSSNEAGFQPTAIDQEILKDKSNYRVLDIPGFGSARSSYFHKTIGGYHAAKLTRYNDLINRQISKNNMGVLNMLNTKYVITDSTYFQNPDALGNAWFVENVDYVATPDQEMTALNTLDTKHRAVADRKFESVIGKASDKTPGDTIYETSYAPNRLTYKAKSAKGGVAVFSEIFFPWGWTATIDGKEAPIGRANYVLRALRIPAGSHDIEFRFDPQSLRTTNAISVASVIAIFILCAAAIAFQGLRTYRRFKSKDEITYKDENPGNK